MPGVTADVGRDTAVDAAVDRPPDVRADAPPDRVVPPDAGPDAADVMDVVDVVDVTDVVDAPDVRDVPDVPDALAVPDVPDVLDVPDVRDVPDVMDVAPDLPPDVPPACMGTTLCPCSATNAGGYCRPGEACTGGRCAMTAGGVAGSLVITELMNDPDAVTDELGEWFEVYNPGATPLDLRGVRISNSRSQSTVVMSASPVLVGPMEYAVLARNGNPATNGGVTARYVYGATVSTNVLTFSNSSTDALILDLGSSATEIDQVRYDASTSSAWPRMMGRSKSLRATALSATANDMPASWCNAPVQWSAPASDYGSPGASNPPCP